MAEIAVIDADFIGRKNHRFPNLCCMKISGYFKACGWHVIFKTDYDDLAQFHKVFVAKVFTDTPLPENGLFGNPLDAPNVIKGGTGFFFDKAQPLPFEIEHHMPDYHLYDGFTDDKHFTDYSIGFLTRGCFRHCPFCVNRRSDTVVAHSPLDEFLDPTRKKICLLDDNFFGFHGWKKLLLKLRDTDKPFAFKQGLDVRLLDDDKAALLFSAKYDGDFIFAFDDVKEAPLIEDKLKLIRRYGARNVKFYVLCGFDRTGRYDNSFWKLDLNNIFARVELIKKYGFLPYLMRHKNFLRSPFPKLYNVINDWCNIPACFRKMSFKQFCAARPYRHKFLQLWEQLST